MKPNSELWFLDTQGVLHLYGPNGGIMSHPNGFGTPGVFAHPTTLIIVTEVIGTGVITFDVSKGNNQQVTLNANVFAVNLINGVSGQELTIIIVQATGPFTLTQAQFNSTKFAGAAYTVTPTPGYRDVLNFIFDGTNWYEQSRAAAVH